jgi:hypothetical protein
MYQREDWTDFRSLNTLGRRAGVPQERLPRLAVKELVDNALDAGSGCRFGRMGDGGFYVEDDGPGFEGEPEEIAALFSIGRPLTSSKLIRRPTRGALGNGLRVVAGAVLASGGTLLVHTRGRGLYLQPLDDGNTQVRTARPWQGSGTRVEIRLGTALDDTDSNLFAWAKQAVLLSGFGDSYRGRSSPWWYDADSFWELFQAAGARTVRDQIADLEGCGGAKAGQIAGAYLNRKADSLSRAEAEVLLARARAQSNPVNARRLGGVGPLPDYPGHARTTGQFEISAARGDLGGTIPFVIEAWARPAHHPSVTVCVNRTPITARVHLQRDSDKKTDYGLYGCNLGYAFTVGRKGDFSLLVNVQLPYVSLTTDGKEPDLDELHKEIIAALEAAVRRARKRGRAASGGEDLTSQKAVVVQALPAAIDRISGGGQSRYSLRQLFYAIRPQVLAVFDKEPLFKTFAAIITEYEDQQGQDLPGIYRDTRGVLYHPHQRREIPLGTLTVEGYQRPPWTFNKILYCEKEGFFPILKDAQWPERHDCALLTSKGFATRAARDVLDLLGETDEPLTFYCIHDADGPGTLIHEKLEQGTKARPARKVQIVNLGLEPAEAVENGLSVEPVRRKDGKAVPVAEYVTDYWRQWLQTKRVELNAMTTPGFLTWLDAKMADYDAKVLPPTPVLKERLIAEVKQRLQDGIVARVLAEADVDGQVRAALEKLSLAIKKQARRLGSVVVAALEESPGDLWSAPVASLADGLTALDRGGPSRRAETNP